jgi:hypothetical protein
MGGLFLGRSSSSCRGRRSKGDADERSGLSSPTTWPSSVAGRAHGGRGRAFLDPSHNQKAPLIIGLVGLPRSRRRWSPCTMHLKFERKSLGIIVGSTLILGGDPGLRRHGGAAASGQRFDLDFGFWIEYAKSRKNEAIAEAHGTDTRIHTTGIPTTRWGCGCLVLGGHVLHRADRVYIVLRFATPLCRRRLRSSTSR